MLLNSLYWFSLLTISVIISALFYNYICMLIVAVLYYLSVSKSYYVNLVIKLLCLFVPRTYKHIISIYNISYKTKFKQYHLNKFWIEICDTCYKKTRSDSFYYIQAPNDKRLAITITNWSARQLQYCDMQNFIAYCDIYIHATKHLADTTDELYEATVSLLEKVLFKRYDIECDRKQTLTTLEQRISNIYINKKQHNSILKIEGSFFIKEVCNEIYIRAWMLFLHEKFGVPNLQIMFSKETINSFSIRNINNTISLSPIKINKFIFSQKKELEKIYYK